MFSSQYEAQVRLLIECLPHVAKLNCFALKGGTAINLFLHDLPRISVDIDLTYLPLKSRDESLQDISNALQNIKADIEKYVPGSMVKERCIQGCIARLSIATQQAEIKIEPNLVLRGCVGHPALRELSPAVQELFGLSARITTLAVEDVYGGKLCAALDRQHPRDIFDIRQLFANGGITPAIRRAFVVYLASHSRPVHELLCPNLVDISPLYEQQFSGMTSDTVTLDELLQVREELVAYLPHALDSDERKFLLAMKSGEPEWNVLGFENLEALPGLQWKLLSIRKMDAQKRLHQIEELKRFWDMN